MSWKAGSPEKLKNTRKWFSLRAFRKEHSANDTLILIQGNLSQTSDNKFMLS